MDGVVRGSCLCGGVRFEVSLPSTAIGDPPPVPLFAGSAAVWDELPDDGLARYEGAKPDADPSARS